MTIRIKLKNLVPNQDWQTRHQLDQDNVERLVQAFKKDAPIPAVLVKGRSGNRFEIFDGFHRYAAAQQLGLSDLESEVFEGSDHEALTEGVKRNMQHGLQLIKADMRRAAQMLYQSRDAGRHGKEVQVGSYRWLGELFGISKDTARSWINEARGQSKIQSIKVARAAERLVKQFGEEGLKEAVLERYGAEALSKSYEPAVKWSFSGKASQGPGVPILEISDVHYGEVVDSEQVFNRNEFNREICKKRLEHTFTKAAELLLTHIAKPDYPGIVLLFAGDLISGAIHEDLAISEEAAPLVQAMEVAKILADGVSFMRAHFKKVDIYCVPGNHGRTTRRPYLKFYAHNNLDWLACKMVADYCVGLKNVTFNVPNARDLTFTVANHRYRLTHGDQFKGGDSMIGCLGPIIRGDARKRVAASLMPGQPEGYDTLVLGHFHQLTMLPRVIVNGSVKGYDEFALSGNFPWEPPSQACWTVHPRHGQTWYAPIYCDPNYVAH